MSLLEFTSEKVVQLQKIDTFCKNIFQHMHCNTNKNYFMDAMDILHKKVIDFNSTFSSVVIPQILIIHLLHASHNLLGHVGATKLYHFLKRLYYFQGMRKKIYQYVRSCQKCQMNLQKPHHINFHQNIAQTPTELHIYWPVRTLQCYITRQLLCPHCSMQPYRLPCDNPYTRQKENDSCNTLVFRNYAKIQFSQNTTFWQWDRI